MGGGGGSGRRGPPAELPGRPRPAAHPEGLGRGLAGTRMRPRPPPRNRKWSRAPGSSGRGGARAGRDRPQAAVSERCFLWGGLGGGARSSAGCPGRRQPRNGKEAAVAAVSPLFRSRFRARAGGARAGRSLGSGRRAPGPEGERLGLRGGRGTGRSDGGRGPPSECRVPGSLGGSR